MEPVKIVKEEYENGDIICTTDTGVVITPVAGEQAVIGNGYYYQPAMGSDGVEYEYRYKITLPVKDWEDAGRDNSNMSDWSEVTVYPAQKIHTKTKCLMVGYILNTVVHITTAIDWRVTDYNYGFDALNSIYYLVYIDRRRKMLYIVKTINGNAVSGFRFKKVTKKDIDRIDSLEVGDEFILKLGD